MMIRRITYWTSVSASQTGTRESNEDFIAIRTLQYGIWRLKLLIVCDGVGGRPEGGACAVAVGEAVISTVQNYLENRKSKLTLSGKETERIARKLLALSINDLARQSACTLAVALVYPKLLGRRWATMVFWAGDSRVYELQEDSGALRLLTNDHSDQEGRLTSYYAGDGRVKGHLSWLYRDGPIPPAAVCVTTDGVHDHCQTEEIRHFLFYCMSESLRTNERLSQELSEFLSLNISDNFSFGLYYRRLTEPHLRTLASDLEED